MISLNGCPRIFFCVFALIVLWTTSCVREIRRVVYVQVPATNRIHVCDFIFSNSTADRQSAISLTRNSSRSSRDARLNAPNAKSACISASFVPAAQSAMTPVRWEQGTSSATLWTLTVGPL